MSERRVAWVGVCLLGMGALLLGCTASVGEDEAEGGGGAGASDGAGAGGNAGAGAGGNAGAGGSASAGTGARAGAGGSAGASGSGRGGAGGSAGTGGRGASGGGSAGAGSGGAGGGGGAGQAGRAGSDAQPSGCKDADYILCEDFESAAVDGIPQGWTKHGDPAGVTGDEAHGGTQSLELGPIPTWERRIYHDAGAISGTHWGRVYFKVKLPVPEAFVHSTLVAFSGDGPTRGASEFRVVDTVKQAADTPDVASRIQFLYNVQPQSSGEFGNGTSYDREFDDAWHCAEWHIDASNQSYAFYLDGEELLSFANGAGHYDGSDIPDSFDEIKIGWINYQDAPPGFTAWLDDLAVDDARIGCE